MLKPKLIAFPYGHGQPYIECLYAGFKAQGIKILKGEWAGRWLKANLNSGDIIHFHWPSYLYESEGSFAVILKSFLRFLMLLCVARMRTRNVWWTAHNLMPHTRCRFTSLDIIARTVVIRVARHVFVHGAEAKKVLLARFPSAAGKAVVIPHGNWIGFYPPCESKLKARLNLKLPSDAFVYLHFGNCRPYKNLDGLIEAFREVATRNDILLIAGRFRDDDYLTKILDLAAGDNRIRIQNCHIADDRVSDYLVACDAMCIPYREILTSGTAMLALSYGRPVLSINRGSLRDVVPPECGILVEPGNRQALAEELRALRSRCWAEADIVRIAMQFTFSDAARISLSLLPAS
jgi:glycosyltransferase involved in cell wall biosynthesis